MNFEKILTSRLKDLEYLENLHNYISDRKRKELLR